MRIPVLVIALLALGVVPVFGQAAASPMDWIPAEFNSFVRVDMENVFSTQEELNIAHYVASRIQPFRVRRQGPPDLNTFFPLDILDTEQVNFQNTILPWLSGDVLLAYREFDDTLTARPDDVLAVLPTDDPFSSASFLSRVVQSQDFPAQETYRGISIFGGDQTAIAFTPTAILIGTPDTLRAAIDAQAGEAGRLADDAVFSTLAEQVERKGTVYAYIDGEEVTRALSVALAGNGAASSLLSALGEALRGYPGGALEAALLSGDVKGIALNLEPDNLSRRVRATAIIATNSDEPAPDVADSAPFDPSILSFIPRSAMVVQSGPDGRTAFYDALVSLPLSGYIFNVLGGFLPPVQADGPQPLPPTGDDIRRAVAGLQAALVAVKDFDLDADLVNHLQGSYAFAMIPRPNNPSPVTGVVYDLLVVAQTDDAEAVAESAKTLIAAVLALDESAFVEETVEDVPFDTLFVEPTPEVAVQIGAVDDVLVVGTGSAARLAVRAWAGDNRLINMERWQAVAGDKPPSLYVDLNAVYNAFLPSSGGAVDQAIGQLGAEATYLGNGVYQLDLTVTVPQSA